MTRVVDLSGKLVCMTDGRDGTVEWKSRDVHARVQLPPGGMVVFRRGGFVTRVRNLEEKGLCIERDRASESN